MSDPFFFFGCWNRDNCEDDQTDYRGMVLELLKSPKVNYNFGIIAGDNVYPVSTSDGKKYYRSTLETGFRALRNATKDKHKHVILGNHNVEKGVPGLNQPGVEDPQRQLIKQLNAGFQLHEASATHVDSNKAQFVFLNTNHFTKEYVKPANIEDPIVVLRSALTRCTNDKPVYIVGHEPLIAAKVKKGEFFTNLDLINEVFDEIKEKFSTNKDHKVFYLCADVHNFQALTITREGFTLPIIVCGTGGADPDLEEVSKCNKDKYLTGADDFKQKIVEGKPYDITVHAIEAPYGFCIINDNQITYHKVNIVSDDQSKLETKTIQLKKNQPYTITMQETNMKQNDFDGKGCSIVLATKPTKPNKKQGGGRRPLIIS
jgi:hypothetical protein